MSKVTLEDVLALNQELAALADVGIPANLAPGASQHEVAGQELRSMKSLGCWSRLVVVSHSGRSWGKL